MSDVLTADEVGALLRAFAQLGERDRDTVQAGSPRVKTYDFTWPVKMSHEGLKHLKHLHATFASAFSVCLSDHLKVPTYSRYAGCSQISYREFWAAQSDNTLLCEVLCESISSRAVIQVSPSIADACLDVLMGGTGSSGANDAELTSVDCVMFARVMEVILHAYRKSWTKYVDIDPRLVNCRTARNFSHPITQNESVIVFDYELRVASTVGTVSICMLADTTAKIPDIKQNAEPEISISDIASLGVLGESVNEAKVECRAILGRADVTIADITNLRPGDILTLDTPINSEVEFWVGNKPAYAGSIGRKGSKVGIKVTRSL